jgi:Predicted membrane protein
MIKILRKWVRYNAIGLMGLGLQLILLFLLTRFVHLNYFVATLFAVQCALIHNFLWHQRYTWKENVVRSKKESVMRFVRFNSSSGTLAIISNLGFTALLVQIVHLPLVVCNLMAIGICNVANFLFANNFVFQPSNNA